MRDIGKNIKELRTKRKMTQDDLAGQLYVTRQTVSNYETGKSRPDIEMLVRISEVLDADIHQVIYGPEKKKLTPQVVRLIVAAALLAGLGIAWVVLYRIGQDIRRSSYDGSVVRFVFLVIRPLFSMTAAWVLAHLISMALNLKPMKRNWARWIGRLLLAAVLIWLALVTWYGCADMLNSWQFENHIRGEWVEVEGVNAPGKAWSILPPDVPDWLSWVVNRFFVLIAYGYSWLYHTLAVLAGVLLRLFGFPQGRQKK